MYRDTEGGRNSRAVVDALEAIAQVLQGQQNQVDNEFCGLRKFHRNNPPIFKGRYDPKGAQAWLEEIKMFRVMAYTEVQKVEFSTYMLSEDVED